MHVLFVISTAVFLSSSGGYAANTMTPQEQALPYHSDDSADFSHDTIESFDAHLSESPNTLGHLRWGYKPLPWTPFENRNALSNAILSSLSLGLGERFEIGTVPVYYIANAFPGVIERNFLLKYNFLKLDRLSLSASYLLNYIEVKISETTYNNASGESQTRPGGRLYYVSHGIQLASSVAISKRTTLGLSAATTISHYRGLIEGQANRPIDELEKYFDVCYRLLDKFSLTAGMSHTQMRIQESATRGTLELGAGLTGTWRRPGAFFSKPSLGIHHLFDTQRNVFLLSTTFY